MLLTRTLCDAEFAECKLSVRVGYPLKLHLIIDLRWWTILDAASIIVEILATLNLYRYVLVTGHQ